MSYTIRNARIVDGTGAPATRGDLVIEGSEITAVGKAPKIPGFQEIDAQGLTLAPGFWDPHTHLEYAALVDREMHGFVAQGVTSVITGSCGHSVFPKKQLRVTSKDLEERLTDVEWEGLQEYAKLVHSRGTPINSSPLIGNGDLRFNVIGNEDRRATPEEMERMLDLLEEGLREGALGMSSGLCYIPSVYSDTDELVEFGKVLAAHNAVYATHTRDCSPIYAYSYHAKEVLAPAEERARHLHGVLEAIEVGRRSGVRTHVAHLHASGIIGTEMAAIREARRQGVDLSVDAMSYNVSYSIRSDALLRRVKERASDLIDLPLEEVKERMRDPEVQDELSRRPQLRRHISPERAGTWELVDTGNPAWERRLVGEIADELGKTPVAFMFERMLDEEHPVTIVPPKSKIKPVRIEQIDDPLIMPCSDAGGASAEPGASWYSARGFVSLARYWTMARDHGVSDEEIIRHMTSLPARRFGVWDRGTVATGQKADLVLFAPGAYQPAADTYRPFEPAEGVHWVFVNGEPILAEGERTGRLPGRVLLRV